MSKKKMTVEMTQPFVWPESPKELDAYVPFPFLSFCFAFYFVLYVYVC